MVQNASLVGLLVVQIQQLMAVQLRCSLSQDIYSSASITLHPCCPSWRRVLHITLFNMLQALQRVLQPLPQCYLLGNQTHEYSFRKIQPSNSISWVYWYEYRHWSLNLAVYSRRSTSKKQIPTPMCRWWPPPGGVFLLPIIIKSMTHALRILEFRNSHFLEFWKHTFPPPCTVFLVPSKFLCACSQHHTTHCHHHHRQDGRRWLKLEGDGKTTKGQDSLLSGVAFIKRTPSESAPLSDPRFLRYNKRSVSSHADTVLELCVPHEERVSILQFVLLCVLLVESVLLWPKLDGQIYQNQHPKCLCTP